MCDGDVWEGCCVCDGGGGVMMCGDVVCVCE